ncbi:MAG: porphobilinogen synthase [Puniceicoccales bacterium]|jgi:porphobilinogen synthase|nr:porphobilinogen synthase [Puniceicoccales bacterium]
MSRGANKPTSAAPVVLPSARLVLPVRPRRLRATAAIREMVAETALAPAQLIQPLFVTGGAVNEPVASLPGVSRLPLAALGAHCRRLAALGIRGVALFPKIDPALKTADGREALNPETLVLRATREIKAAAGDALLVFNDIALDPYTTHGHDGVLSARGGDDVDNDATVAVLAEMAVLNAAAGADFVAPSDMMDGRVAAIRAALDAAGHERAGIMAYSAKFASCYYGPFREAVGAGGGGGATGGAISKAGYQLAPGNRREALREACLDEQEGADIVMVKPAGPYLDIIRDVRERAGVPVAAYQVSGEYAQIHAAAERGWLDLRRTRDEALLAIRRAGADLILTYFAEAWARDYA